MIFGLSKLAPGDPVELLLKGGSNAGNTGQRADLVSSERAYQDKARELGLDRPTFYFSITSAAYPKDLYKIQKQNHRETISRLIDQYGNSEAVMAYYEKLRDFELNSSDDILNGAFETRRDMRDAFGEIYFKYEENDVRIELEKMRIALSKDPATSVVVPKINEVIAAYENIINNPNKAALYTPTIHWYGTANQYHTWMFGDYPWFITPDTSANVKLAEINKQMADIAKEQDTLTTQKNKVAEDLHVMHLQLDLLSDKEVNKDSIRQIMDAAAKDSLLLVQKIEEAKNQYAAFDTQRQEISKDIKVFASKGFLRLDFGKSYRDSDSVGKKILQAMFWTVIMNVISIFFSYIISIPLGVQSAVWKKNTLQFFNVFSYHALATTLGYAILMVLYAKGSIDASTHFWGLMLCMGIYIGIEFFRQRAYIKEKAADFKIIHGIYGIVFFALAAGVYAVYTAEYMSGALTAFLAISFLVCAIYATRAISFPLIYIFSLGLVIFWSYIILEMLLLGAIFMYIKSPIMLLYTAIVVLALWGLGKYLNRNKVKDNTQQLWDDGKGSFQFGKSGIQLRGYILDNICTAVLFLLYSLPSFWIATILLVFLTGADYGISWFPTGGAYTMELHQNPETSNYAYVIDVLHHLILPVFCMTYGSFAFLSRQTRGSMLGVLRQDYIRTANAKGLQEDKVIWKHAFRNSLFPIITLFSSVFPRALSGSIAIELIYNIPGMGVLALSSIVARDWPVVFAISMLAALLTMIGNLVADMLYGVADPRVTFK